jgi:membrane protease YdiL (CAAX protease family)
VLSAKPWNSEAIIRLLVSIFLCLFLGSVAMAVVRFSQASLPINPWVFGVLVAGSAICCCVVLFILRKPWELGSFTLPFILMLLCLYLGLVLGAFAQHFAGKSAGENPTLRTVVATLTFQGAALVFIWRLLREHQLRWRDAFGFSVKWKMALLFGVLIACGFVPVGEGLLIASAKIMSAVGVKPELQPAIQALKDTATGLDRLVLGVIAIVLAPVGEELLFRGVLYPAVKQAGFPRLALWGTAFVFAAIHVNLATLLPLFVLAVALTLLYEKTGNLLAPIAAHSLFNLYNFAKFFLFEMQLNKSG